MASAAASKTYTLSAGIVPIRGSPGQAHFLILRAYSYWDFPKGVVEPGENPLQAAIREVREETGLTNLVFRWGETYRETPPYRGSKIARYYLAESPHGEVILLPNPALGRAEHQEFRWVEFGEAQALLVPRLRAILEWANGLLQRDSVRG